jgi:anti-sigma factor RsiW
MTHPEPLLADYVDGTLRDQDRAVVDAHLATCAVCREEVDQARSAVAALSSLEDVPVPLGVTGPVLAEAGRRFEHRRATAWRRIQWAAGAAAAAALVAVVVVSTRPGEEPAERAEAPMAASAPAERAGAEAAVAPPPRLEVQRDVTYTEDGVRALSEDAAREVKGGDEPGVTGEAALDEADLRLAAPGAALECLRASQAPVDEPSYRLVRLIEARFGGRPAYLAVFLQSPGAGQPPDHSVVWVAAKETCQTVHTASLPI